MNRRFFGKEISDYGEQNNQVDYRTLSSTFDGVLNNYIMNITTDWEYFNGDPYEAISELESEISDINNLIYDNESEIKCLFEELNNSYGFDYDYDDIDNLSTADICKIKNVASSNEHYARMADSIEIIISKIGENDKYKKKIENFEEEINNLQYTEIFQYFIISSKGAEILKYYTNDIVFYSEEFDMYVWGVEFYGTGWDYVLTGITFDENDSPIAKHKE